MSGFWLARGTSSSPPAMHLTGDFSAVETAISHLAYAAQALDRIATTEADRARVLALVERINRAVGA